MLFFQKMFKKISGPILDQLKQGVTPHKLAQSIAFGIVIGVSPVLGLTTALCILAAYIFRLNHIAIQAVNYLAYPLQLALLIPFIKIGERLYLQPYVSLNVLSIVEQFKINIKIALQKYFLLGLMGATAWLIMAPIIFAVVYTTSKLVLTRVMVKDLN